MVASSSVVTSVVITELVVTLSSVLLVMLFVSCVVGDKVVQSSKLTYLKAIKCCIEYTSPILITVGWIQSNC